MQGRLHRVTTFFHRSIAGTASSATDMAFAFNGASRNVLLHSDVRLGNVFSCSCHSCLHQSQPLLSASLTILFTSKLITDSNFMKNMKTCQYVFHLFSVNIFIHALRKPSHSLLKPQRSESRQETTSCPSAHLTQKYRSENSGQAQDSPAERCFEAAVH